MRNESPNKTLITIIRQSIGDWRKREGWSRETVVQAIVEAHQSIGGIEATEIVFEPISRDAFTRMKVNADRVFRWLDDETKDKNLLPANFVQSILAAMPFDMRFACLNEYLGPIGLNVRGIDAASDHGLNAQRHVLDMIKESGEAIHAVAGLISEFDLSALERARRELDESIEAKESARRAIDAAIAKVKGCPLMVVPSKHGAGSA